jgi:V/A-type H+/Na+-transporting ATPase subunit D
VRKVSTTRAELLAHKTQIALARQGRNLLEQKRTILMKEFMRAVNTVVQHADALQLAASTASRALGRAESVAGVEAVRSAALAARGNLPLNIKMVNIMGVKVPHIDQRNVARSMLNRGYSIYGTSIAVDEAAAAFEDEVESILRLAESELRLARLSGEIQRTARRLNALDNHLIPRLEAEEKFIRMALDERERSDHFRLKLVKHALQQKAEQQD